ncbi:hypothetical protein K402DRAFT_398171 [Aulographum hederae CBS 113979]|uniref:Small ribosomal subunit protein mS33 n=1 Tax=Aulographum hederae CBS 113979 TaxID=1176131 RepID=A0A6G1GM31_9PEZI|nr:hypothetical protein K402DRAFT_398171 [Aulographum hederae CBS 113979]
MAVPRARILDLMKAQCRIFNTTYNPERLRMGNKVLRQRLRGPAMTEYYPPRTSTIKKLREKYPGWHLVDEREDERFENIKIAKARGKGAPKKKRTAEESKKNSKRKPGQAAS